MAVKIYSLTTDGNKNISEHFKIKEFASRSGSKIYSNTVKINTNTVKVLEKLFEYKNLGIDSIKVTSGYRTEKHDISVAGHSYSRPHTTGKAVDFICFDKNGKVISAKKICCVLEDIGGVYGIGYISPNAVHIDVDYRTKSKKWWGDETTKGQRTIWFFGYKSWYNYFTNPYEKPKTELKKGCSGESVWWVQYQLKRKGYLKGKITGNFGNKTEKAVKNFKKKNGLGGKKTNGTVGEKTVRFLEK